MRRGRLDYFGNKTTYFGLTEPHQCLDIMAQSLVDITIRRDVDCSQSPGWESVRDHLALDRRRDTLQAYQMAFESEHVRNSELLSDYAASAFQPLQPILCVARDLTRQIHQDFTYDPNATDIHTPLDLLLESAAESVRILLTCWRGACVREGWPHVT